MNDKKCRYESHEAFLKKCIENSLVPNGLKVYVEPSIGNRDDTFLAQWHSRLEPRTLTTDVIGYCENEIAKTKNEITEISDRLKALVTTPVFTNISKTIDTNEKSRVNELTQRKNRKFYRLKYRNDDRKQADTKRFEPREPQSKVLYSNRGHRGMGNQNNYSSGEENRDDEPPRNRHNDRNRETGYGNRRNAARNEHSNRDHNERVIEVIERRTDRQNRNYAAAVTGPNLRTTDNREPLHEQLALTRRNSRRNVGQRNQEDFRHNEPGNDKDREISELKSRLETMERERNQKEQVTSHYSRDTNTNDNQKNVIGAQCGKGPEETDLKEMKTFLKGVLDTISAFDRRLTAQMDSSPTRSDK